MVELELPYRKRTVDGGDFEDLKRPQLREKKLPKSNSKGEMNHLPKSNQPI